MRWQQQAKDSQGVEVTRCSSSGSSSSSSSSSRRGTHCTLTLTLILTLASATKTLYSHKIHTHCTLASAFVVIETLNPIAP